MPVNVINIDVLAAYSYHFFNLPFTNDYHVKTLVIVNIRLKCSKIHGPEVITLTKFHIISCEDVPAKILERFWLSTCSNVSRVLQSLRCR